MLSKVANFTSPALTQTLAGSLSSDASRLLAAKAETVTRVANAGASSSETQSRRLLGLNNYLDDIGGTLAKLTGARDDAGQVVEKLRALRATLVEPEADGEDRAGAPVYQTRDVMETRAVYEDRPVFETRDVFEDRAVYEAQAIYETRAVFETRPVMEQEAVYETDPVYETRPVYEARPVYETSATGSRRLDYGNFDFYQSTGDAGIRDGAELRVRVGDGQMAKIIFRNDEEIRVEVGADRQTFRFDDDDGEWRDGLVEALNSIEGLEASFNASGYLELKTADAQTLTLTDGRNSPLARLGLSEGTVEAAQIGEEQVLVGEEQVQVGEEQVLVGYRDVQVGEEQVQVGEEQVVAGWQDVQVGLERILVGQEQVRTGEERVAVGEERVKVGEEQVLTGYRPGAAPGSAREETVSVAEKIRGLMREIDGLSSADRPQAGLLAGGSVAMHLSSGDSVDILGDNLSSRTLSLTGIESLSSQADVERAIVTVDRAITRATILGSRMGSQVDIASTMQGFAERMTEILGSPVSAPRSDAAAAQMARSTGMQLSSLGGIDETGLVSGKLNPVMLML